MKTSVGLKSQKLFLGSIFLSSHIQSLRSIGYTPFLQLRPYWGPSISDVWITPLGFSVASLYCRLSAHGCHVNILKCSFLISQQLKNLQWSPRVCWIKFRQITLPKHFHGANPKYFLHQFLIRLYSCYSPYLECDFPLLLYFIPSRRQWFSNSEPLMRGNQ